MFRFRFSLTLRRLHKPLSLLYPLAVCLAETVYDNGPPDHAQGWEIDSFTQADDIELNKSARIETVTFWILQAGPFSGSVYWEIYSNAARSPGTLLYSGLATNVSYIATGITVPPAYPEFLVTFNIVDPVSLQPGVYWLALHDGPKSNSAAFNIYWETTPGAGARPSQEKYTNTAGPWYYNVAPGFPSELAFQVSGVFAPDITSISYPAEGTRVTFTTVTGYNYGLEYKNDLSDPLWVSLAGAELITGTGSTVEIVDHSAAGLQRRFYRAKLL